MLLIAVYTPLAAVLLTGAALLVGGLLSKPATDRYAGRHCLKGA
jgi:hypothetical protein